MKHDFFSNHAINDEVDFRPMYRHQQQMGIPDEFLDGKVVAVRFTEAKVFYDIYCPYWGRIFDEVSSEKVFGITKVELKEDKIGSDL